MALSINAFVNQAVKLGEKSDKVVQLKSDGKLDGVKIGSRERRSEAFRASNQQLWNQFGDSLKSSFNMEELPPQVREMATSGQPLTARTIIQATKETQSAARMEVYGKLMGALANADAAGPAGENRTFLLSQPNERLLDGMRELKKERGDEFQGLTHDQTINLLADKLREMDGRDDDFVGGDNAVGLGVMDQGTIIGRDETSVGDRSETLTVGKSGIGRIDDQHSIDHGSHRFLYQGLKDKGIEPGFLVTKNWLPSHEQRMTGGGELGEADPLFQNASAHAEATVNAVLNGEDRDAAGRMFVRIALSQPDRELAERVLVALNNGEEPVALLAELPDDAVANFARASLRDERSEFHDELAAASRAHIRETAPEFTEKHIIKLDYNESDRHVGRLFRSAVNLEGRKWYMHLYSTTKRSVNAGAVAESLANDITRALGVPAQKLQIVKGEYSDGGPKLMLDGAHIKGQNGAAYQDFDHFIRDGYLDKDLLRATGHEGSIRGLASHKAAFLLLGDRDAVGSKGQNKGFVGNTFAAIDPGHSLEGNRVTLNDDFSFTSSTKFPNFSVFDDSPMSERMAGWDRIERTVQNGGIGQLFADYSARFNEQAGEGLDFSEQIGVMQREFETRYNQMRGVLSHRLDIFRSENGPQLLDALDNVEKLSSTTSTTSPKGDVKLDHLRVEKREAWDLNRTEDGIVLSCRERRHRTAENAKLGEFLRGRGFEPVFQDGSLVVPEDRIPAFLNVMTESNVRRFKGQL